MIPRTLRIFLFLLILLYFFIILHFLKKKAISLKYTLMWLVGGVFMAVLAIWPRIIIWIKHLIGVESNMNVLYMALIGFMLVLLMALTSIVSGQSEKMKKLTQSIALMEKRIRELEYEVQSGEAKVDSEKSKDDKAKDL